MSANDENDLFNLETYILKDPESIFSLQDVLKKDQEFQTLPENIVIEGYRPQTIWIKAVIYNHSDYNRSGYFLPQREAVLSADLYFQEKNFESWTVMRNGYLSEESPGVLKDPIAFQLKIPAKSSKTVYLRFSGT
ncbi:MAG: hypothetical protein OEZ34_12150, partial [Spirochaetia bacterium]|nr:hypothetical protein [Spirochaetia bacterium]